MLLHRLCNSYSNATASSNPGWRRTRNHLQASQAKGQLQQRSLGWRCTVIQRVLASKGLVAYVLACATGITLYFRWPFPENDLMLHLISIRAPLTMPFSSTPTPCSSF